MAFFDAVFDQNHTCKRLLELIIVSDVSILLGTLVIRQVAVFVNSGLSLYNCAPILTLYKKTRERLLLSAKETLHIREDGLIKYCLFVYS